MLSEHMQSNVRLVDILLLEDITDVYIYLFSYPIIMKILATNGMRDLLVFTVDLSQLLLFAYCCWL